MSAILYFFYAVVIIATLRQLVRLGLSLIYNLKRRNKETRRGATVAKIGFLIGLLFLAGGIFYFFANAFTNMAEPNPTASPAPTISPSPSPTASPSPLPTIPSPSPTAAPTPTPTPTLTLSISAPSQVGMNTVLSISFIVNNPTGSTAHVAYIETNGLFTDFSVQSYTHEIVANNVINIGNAPSGANVASVQLLSPNRAGTFSYTIILRFQEMTAPISQNLSIQVRGN